MTMEETEYSTRDQFGNIEFFNSIEEALESFLGYDGYRLTVALNNKMVHMYRDQLPEMNEMRKGSLNYDNPSAIVKYEARIAVYR